MAITKEQATFTDNNIHYYTDQLNFSAGDGTITYEKILFTSDPALIDTTKVIADAIGRYLKGQQILIRAKV